MHFRDRDGLLECYQFTELGDCVLAGRSLQPLKRAQRRLGWNLAGVGAAVLALGLGGGWWLSTRALRPVEEIRAAAERISGGALSERIATTEPDSEVGRLAGVLNATFDRLEAAFVRQRRFTDDAAHELRTPLAVLLVEAQSALSRDRSPEEYRETLKATLATAQQMRRLTDSLLQLARLDEGDGLASALPVDVDEVARSQAEALRPLAVGKGLQLEVHAAAARVQGDAERLGQVVTNLVANAIQYTPSGGTVKVRTAASGNGCLIVVQDSGIGIAAEDLPHVFDRFFRADRARRRAEGHSGLGLAICRAIVEAHRGRISVESAPGAGSTFTVRLPAAKAA
jgi:two-component system, OmpR family, sensor kinase